MSDRDEQLEALESAVKSAEKKLKQAKIAFWDIEESIESNEEEFQSKFTEKSAGYKKQTGAVLIRNVDVNGNVTYEFSRDMTPKEKKKRRTLKVSRQFDNEKGKAKFHAEFENVANPTVEVKSTANLEKQKGIKRFIAYKVFVARFTRFKNRTKMAEKIASSSVQTAKDLANRIADTRVGKKVTEAKKAVSNRIFVARYRRNQKKVRKAIRKEERKAAKAVSSPVHTKKDLAHKFTDTRVGKKVTEAKKAVSDRIFIAKYRRSQKKSRKAKKFVFNPFLTAQKFTNKVADTKVGKGFRAATEAVNARVQTAKNFAGKVSNSEVGKSVKKGIKKAAKAAPDVVVLPINIVRDITEKGGIIHSAVDLGDRIRIEGVNVPKPLKVAGNVTKGIALGAETATVEAAKGIKKFSVDIAKNKINEEINKSISENDSANVVYIIGTKTIEVYRILDEHTKFKRAVLLDEISDEITDINVSRYLAEKREKKFSRKQKKLGKKIDSAKEKLTEAQNKYNEAKRRLEQYKAKKNDIAAEKSGISPSKSKKHNTSDKTNNKVKSKSKTKKLSQKEDKVSKSQRKTDSKIIKTSKKIYNLHEKSKKPVANTYNTVKKLDGLAISTSAQSLRSKAMRDGGDNIAVEASNSTVSALQSAYRLNKSLNEKEFAAKENYYKKKLTALENKSDFEKKLQEKSTKDSKLREKKQSQGKNKKKKSNKKKTKEQQKDIIKKKHHRMAHTEFVKQGKKEAERAIASGVKSAARSAGNAFVPIFILLSIIILIILTFLLLFGIAGVSGINNVLTSPCSTNDLTLCDRYYTELAKNMIDKHQNVEVYYPYYDKYVCLTDIDSIEHSPQRLLPYLGVKTLSNNGNDEWSFEDAIPYIEDIFNSEYEFYTNEIHEVRKNVTTRERSSEDSFYSELGTSTYQLDRPDGADIPEELASWGYSGYANTYTHVEVVIASGYTTNTLDNVGIFTDIDGNVTEYDEMQTVTFYNMWCITLVFDWFDDHYEEYWQYKEEYQDYYEYEYNVLEYSINENQIDTDSNFSTATGDWQDTNFDKLIYNRVNEFSDEERDLFEIYCEFLMGHQFLVLPFKNAEISKYAGYDNNIHGDMSLDYAIELRTYYGQEIRCGMDGDITQIDDNIFSVYNKEYGIIYYENASVPTQPKANKGEVISTSLGDTLRITFIDNKGNILNPLFIFGT